MDELYSSEGSDEVQEFAEIDYAEDLQGLQILRKLPRVNWLGEGTYAEVFRHVSSLGASYLFSFLVS
jgi:hypothetical protein